MTILVASAWLPEQGWLRERVHDLGHRCVTFLLTGIGPARASAAVAGALSRAPSEAPVERVIFIGTAGAYDTGLHPVGQTVFAMRALAIDGATLLGASYIPGTTDVAPYDAFESLGHGDEPPLEGLARVTCACPPSITKDPALARRFAHHAAVENLELAGVAAACHAGPTWCAFLGVSNAVGPRAHEEWQAHHEAASVAACRAAASFLDSLLDFASATPPRIP